VVKSLEQKALSLGGVRREVDARHLDPMRPTPGRPPLVGEAWLYELKLDGFRLLADVRRRDVVLRYRSGHVCTDAFPELVESLGAIGLSRVVLDGEVVAFDEKGRPDFDRLGPRLAKTRGPKPPVSFHVFDVLAVGAVDVRSLALGERKHLLEGVVARSKGALRSVPYTVGDGRQLAAFIDEHDLEGLVAKRVDSSYQSGPSPGWVKAKRRHEEDFIVARCRWGRDGQIDALSLATEIDGELAPAGVVEIGASRARELVESGIVPVRGWCAVTRRIVVSVTYTGRTSAGRLREAAVKGLRVD